MFNKRNILKYSERHGFKEEETFLALEERFTIFFNNLKIISLLCSPENIEELAVGFLFAEGLTCTNNDYWEIYLRDNKEIYVYAEQIKDMENFLVGGTLTSGCGQGMTFLGQERIIQPFQSYLNLGINKILDQAKAFEKQTLLEKNTGGVHNAGLLFNGRFIVRKDVGRHNAVDKICGYCLLNGVDPKDAVLFLTGRVSSEIIMKGVKMRIPFVVSLSGATAMAAELAQGFGITLLGYVRGKSAVIYSHPERINP